MKQRRFSFVCGLLVLAALALNGCGGSGTTAASDPGKPQSSLVAKPGQAKVGSMYSDPQLDFTWDLIAGQNQNAGTVHVYNDASTLFVAYNLSGSWQMTEAHVLVSTTPPNPKGGAPGQFPYSQTFNPAVSSYTFQISLADLSLSGKTKVYLATHAATTSGETIWGGYWNNGNPRYDFNWAKKWGGGFTTHVMPVFNHTDWRSYSASHFGPQSYWGVNFADNSYPFPGNNTWNGWCVDLAHSMYPNYPYEVQLWSCYDPNLPSFAQSGNWDLISYILTKRNAGAGIYAANWAVDANKEEFQTAVWYFMGGGGAPASGSLADQIVQDALANGDGFIPGPGQYYAVILFPHTETDNNTVRAQMNIIEVDP